MSTVENLRGGLSGNDFGAALDAARNKLTNRKDQEVVSLTFLEEELTDKERMGDGRISRDWLARHVDGIADKAFGWILNVARPFFRKLDKDIRDIGEEILDDTCEDSDAESNAQRQKHYEERIELLLSFSPDNDKDVREELELLPERRRFFGRMFCRINDAARLALLVDDFRYAEDKDSLECLLKTAKDGSGNEAKVVFVGAKPTDEGCLRVFGKHWRIMEESFGYWHDFACEELATAVSTRSRELATAHKNEVKKQEQEVSAKAETDVSPDDLLFGNPAEVNEKTAPLSWKHLGHQNTVRVRRSGNRLYIISTIGKPNEALGKTQEELGEPFILLDCILDKDGEHLCFGKMEDGKPRYDFGGFIKREIFLLACWVRTAAGACLPDRLLPDDETRPTVSGMQPSALVDNDGKEAVTPEVFYFRTANGGAGTITVNLPDGFILYLDEVKDEKQKVLAPERDIKVQKPAVMKIRRAIIGGKPKIILDSCDDVAVMQELQLNGIPGVEWTETGKKNWVGLPNPLPGILSFRYKLACEAGELKPNARR